MNEVSDKLRHAALDVLEIGRKFDKWDQAPSLIAVIDDDPMAFAPIDIPTDVWDGQNPADVLAGLCMMIMNGAEVFDPDWTGEIAGVLLVTEAYTIDSNDLSPAHRAGLREWAKHNNLRDHPSGKAREARTVTVVDRHMTAGYGKHVRGQGVDPYLVYGAEGRIPDAVKAVTGLLVAAWDNRTTHTP